MRILFNDLHLGAEQNNHTTKTVNAYIIYDLENWSKISLNNFTLKNCLFCLIYIVKNNNKSKYVHSSYGRAFDGASESSFGASEKKFNTNFSKAKSKFCLSLHCNNDNSYFLL